MLAGWERHLLLLSEMKPLVQAGLRTAGPSASTLIHDQLLKPGDFSVACEDTLTFG